MIAASEEKQNSGEANSQNPASQDRSTEKNETTFDASMVSFPEIIHLKSWGKDKQTQTDEELLLLPKTPEEVEKETNDLVLTISQKELENLKNLRLSWSEDTRFEHLGNPQNSHVSFASSKQGLSSFVFGCYRSCLGVVQDNELVYSKTNEDLGRFQYLIDAEYASGFYYLLNDFRCSNIPCEKIRCLLRKSPDAADPIIFKRLNFVHLFYGGKSMRSANQSKGLIIYQKPRQLLFLNLSDDGQESSYFSQVFDFFSKTDKITGFGTQKSLQEDRDDLFVLSSEGEVWACEVNYKQPSNQMVVLDKLALCLSTSQRQTHNLSSFKVKDKASTFICASE